MQNQIWILGTTTGFQEGRCVNTNRFGNLLHELDSPVSEYHYEYEREL